MRCPAADIDPFSLILQRMEKNPGKKKRGTAILPKTILLNHANKKDMDCPWLSTIIQDELYMWDCFYRIIQNLIHSIAYMMVS